MADLSTQPYKGTRDFYPEDMRLQSYIFNVWRNVVERFGYEEMMAPLLELTDLYRAKTGEEIVNEQAYNFTDRGGREVTIRPEMTPSVARMVAARNQELTYPLRWYSIANFLRYERPQRGRLREHWQLNTDIFGVKGIEAEAEIIRVADSILRAFGADDSVFSIRLNSRQLMSLLLGEHLKLDVEDARRVSKLIDRKDKMSEAAFFTQVNSVLKGDTDKLLNLLSIDSITNLPTAVIESGTVEELRQLFDRLESYGIKNVQFDMTLMRGFDYYTGVIFELFDTSPENRRALFGGGRYDELTSVFRGPSVPAVGFGMGDVTIRDFLTTHELLPQLNSSTQVYVVIVGDQLTAAQELASKLRQSGIKVAVDLSAKKPEAAIKAAVKTQIPYMVFVGDAEVKSQKYQLKNLANEQEAALTVAEIIARLRQ